MMAWVYPPDTRLTLARQRWPMPRRMGYLAAAVSEFLEHLPCRSPAEAVECGMRSVEEWCACLVRARLASGLAADEYMVPRSETDLPLAWAA
jgi:hypothetical protein